MLSYQDLKDRYDFHLKINMRQVILFDEYRYDNARFYRGLEHYIVSTPATATDFIKSIQHYQKHDMLQHMAIVMATYSRIDFNNEEFVENGVLKIPSDLTLGHPEDMEISEHSISDMFRLYNAVVLGKRDSPGFARPIPPTYFIVSDAELPARRDFESKLVAKWKYINRASEAKMAFFPTDNTTNNSLKNRLSNW